MNPNEDIYLGFLEDPEEGNDLSLKGFPSFAGGIPLWLHYNSPVPNIICSCC